MSERPDSSEPRQRYRFVVARSADAPALAQREAADAWIAAIDGAGLPVARTEGEKPRPRISFGAPLPIGMAAEADLIDVVLLERWPVWRVREALDGRVPEGWQLLQLQDVWLAGPPLAGRVAAADYRIELSGSPDVTALASAADQLLATRSIVRERPKGATTVPYDLRPLLIDVRVDAGATPVVLTRTRFHPELGTGRPEEVLAALADGVGAPLEARSIVRERLLLIDDLD